MVVQLTAVCFDTNDPRRVAMFWGELLGREVADDPRGGAVLPHRGERGFAIRFVPSEQRKQVPNHVHFDLTSTSTDEQRRLVAAAIAGGAQHIDVGQRPEEGHVVLADPEGNEFCVLPAGNRFLAGCGLLGAVNGDGSHAAGRFWSAALGWPLVWDEGEETAIQDPAGGSKLAWGGSPVAPKVGKSRVHFDLAPAVGGDQQSEVERLVELGARRLDIGQGDVGWTVMADPDGREFCVLATP